MPRTHEPHLRFALAGLAAGLAIADLLGRIGGARGRPVAWALAVALLALGAAVVTARRSRRGRRRPPTPDPPEDGFVSAGRPPVEASARAPGLGAGEILLGLGVLVVAVLLVLGMSRLGLRGLYHDLAGPTFDTPAARTRQGPRLVVRHPLVHFERRPRAAGAPGPGGSPGRRRR